MTNETKASAPIHVDVMRPTKTLEVVYHWDNGTDEVMFRREAGSVWARFLQIEVMMSQKRAEKGGYVSPYTWRIV